MLCVPVYKEKPCALAFQIHKKNKHSSNNT